MGVNPTMVDEGRAEILFLAKTFQGVNPTMVDEGRRKIRDEETEIVVSIPPWSTRDRRMTRREPHNNERRQ